ncbi:unnamed protein product [Ixodes pacificus]
MSSSSIAMSLAISTLLSSSLVTFVHAEDTSHRDMLAMANVLGDPSGNTSDLSTDFRSLRRNSRSVLDATSASLLGAAAAMGLLGVIYPILASFGKVPSGPHERVIFGRGLAGLSEFVMTRVDKGLEKFPSIPSLDPQECMKRSVCEAHNQPNKYGLIGLALQLLYPPYSAPDEPTTVVSKYQLAARYGRQEDADCSRQYDGCIVSPLEIIQTVVTYFLR